MANDNQKASPAEIQKHLGGVDYPASKQELIRHAKDQDAPEDVISVLNRVEDRSYDSPADLMKAVGKVE